MGLDGRKSRTGKGGVPIIMIQSSSDCVAEHRTKPRSHLLSRVSPACTNQRVMRVKGKVSEAKGKGRERKGKRVGPLT